MSWTRRSLCGQGPAPAGATIAHYRGLGLDLVPGAGPLAAAIPGSTIAWLTLLHDHGTRRLVDVLGYAIGYAERGHPLLANTVATIARVKDLFSNDWTTSAEVYLPHGEPPVPGERFSNPALARTYRRLLEAEAAATGGRGGRHRRRPAGRGARASWPRRWTRSRKGPSSTPGRTGTRV